MGIGNIYLPELQFIASDPDPLHVFLLNSYNDAPAFVDFLSFTTCDSESDYVCVHVVLHAVCCIHASSSTSKCTSTLHATFMFMYL